PRLWGVAVDLAGRLREFTRADQRIGDVRAPAVAVVQRIGHGEHRVRAREGRIQLERLAVHRAGLFVLFVPSRGDYGLPAQEVVVGGRVAGVRAGLLIARGVADLRR